MKGSPRLAERRQGSPLALFAGQGFLNQVIQFRIAKDLQVMFPNIQWIIMGQDGFHGPICFLHPAMEVNNQDSFLHSRQESLALCQSLGKGFDLLSRHFGHPVQLVSECGQIVLSPLQPDPPVKESFGISSHDIHNFMEGPA